MILLPTAKQNTLFDELLKITKSKKLKAQPESLARAPKKRKTHCYSKTKLKTKRKLDTLMLSNYILEATQV